MSSTLDTVRGIVLATLRALKYIRLTRASFTELKNKAVKRYYLVDARNKVEAAINSLPPSDEPGAAARFAEVERVIASSKRHLGDELHGQFSITLADMKPEYVG